MRFIGVLILSIPGMWTVIFLLLLGRGVEDGTRCQIFTVLTWNQLFSWMGITFVTVSFQYISRGLLIQTDFALSKITFVELYFGSPFSTGLVMSLIQFWSPINLTNTINVGWLNEYFNTWINFRWHNTSSKKKWVLYKLNNISVK